MIPRSITLAMVCVGLSLCAAVSATDQDGKSDGESRAASTRRGNRLLLIAPERFHAGLSEFVRHKNQLLPTELVSLEHVLRVSSGVDDPERLKRYLYTQWREQQVGYVLLVGDVDVLPVRYMVLDRVTPQACDYAFYPADLYYSDLAKQDGGFDDWNGQKESFHAAYFGEVRGEKNKQDAINFDGVDYRPDIAVGRWPVSSEAEVQLVAAKTQAYETGVLAHNKAGQDRAAVFVVGGWVDARGRVNHMVDALAANWSIEKRFYSDGNPTFDTPPPDETQLLELLNGGVGLVIHAGHGSDLAWEQCFSVQSFDRLHNADRLPVMISAGCSTAICGALGPYQAYIDVDGREHEGTDRGEVFQTPPPPPAVYQTGRFNPTGLGEQLLRQKADGAVAYIGCNTGSQPCALTLVEGFTKALAADPQTRLGDCWSDAIAYYYQHEQLEKLVPTDDWYPASIFFQGMKFMLFGDPSLRLRIASDVERK
jgi:hypothetical protein